MMSANLNTGLNRRSAFFRNGLLAVLLFVAVIRLSRVEWHTVLVSSVAEFLPTATADHEEASAAMREVQSRLVFFGGRTVPFSSEIAGALAESLEALPEVLEVGVGFAQTIGRDLSGVLYRERFELRFPDWLAEGHIRYDAASPGIPFTTWLAQDAVARLDAFLDSADSLGFEDLLVNDPLLLLPSTINQMASMQSEQATSGETIVWLRLDGDPLSGDFQARVLPELERVVGEHERAHEGLTITWFGAIRFAAESRETMQREVEKLNLLTLLLVGGIAILALRRPWQLIHLLVPVVSGLLGGLAMLSLCFAQIHILSLVMGSILAGVAIDYGVHLYFHDGRDGSDRAVVRALLISGLSTIVGYLVWAGSSLSLSQQTGVFVAAGLASALISVLLYTPLRTTASPRLEALFRKEIFPVGLSTRGLILGLFLVVVVALGWTVRWDDSLGMLDIPHPELDEAVAAIAVQGGGGQGQLVYAAGSSFVEVAERLRKVQSAGFSLAPLFPSAAAIAAVDAFRDDWPTFRVAWRDALAAREFEVEVFDDFENDLVRYLEGVGTDSVALAGDALADVFRGPSSVLIGYSDDIVWLGTWRNRSASMEVALPEGVARLDVREELESMIGRWRAEQIRLSLLGIGVIAVLVVFMCPIRAWALVTLLPLGAVGSTLCVVGWAMGGLNFFHLAGALLGFCVTLDYVVFFDQCRRAGEPFPASIRFSAITTIAAFGVLLLSQVEGVRSLGATVAVSVLFSILGLELMRPQPSTKTDE